MIEIKQVSKVYNSKTKTKTIALDDVSFTLPNKGLIFILGKSGSGKTTLLNILGGLDKYDSGDLIVNGKSTKKFNEKDYDYYRNTHIGFVFQEFNLLEEYNVYDNIILSRQLQRENVSLKVIDDLLSKVGIGGFGKRRINELSGGQKSRVAIARALIKNPDVLLADEPTGSLDQETGRQIFDLLKSISKEKLVVVVSHDREFASNYADGIIEIHDGKILSNNISITEEKPKEFKTKKSKLPFRASMKFAFLNLANKKLKLFFTCLLLFMALTFFGTALILSEFAIEKSHARAMADTNQQYITIQRAAYNDLSNEWYDSGSDLKFTKEDVEEIKTNTNLELYPVYKLNENNVAVGLSINSQGLLTDMEKVPAYYLSIINEGNLKFVEAKEEAIVNTFIGKYPTEFDEIMIHSYLADYMMEAGVLLADENSIFSREYYKPTRYEDLLNDELYLKLGSTKVKVVGIILDNTEPYQHLKELPSQDILNNNETFHTWLGISQDKNRYNEFGQMIVNPSFNIYVAKGFIDNIPLCSNVEIDTSNQYNIVLTDKEHKIYGNKYRYLNEPIEIYNGKEFVTIENLNDNEIIVNPSYLEKISNGDYTKLKEKYIESKKDSEYSPQEIEREFLIHYLEENNILGSMQTLEITDYTTKEVSKYENMNIIGIQDSLEATIYIPYAISSNFIQSNSSLVALQVKSNNEKELEKILTEFPIFANKKYFSETVYSNSIAPIYTALLNLRQIALYGSMLFGVFAFILLTNFIVSSIYYSKKTIGILRGMGARKNDVFKIFLNEGLLIGLISLVFVIAILMLGIYLGNSYISSHLFFFIPFILFTWKKLVILVGSVILIIILSSLFTIRKIAKMNPVDAILNK